MRTTFNENDDIMATHTPTVTPSPAVDVHLNEEGKLSLLPIDELQAVEKLHNLCVETQGSTFIFHFY